MEPKLFALSFRLEWPRLTPEGTPACNSGLRLGVQQEKLGVRGWQRPAVVRPSEQEGRNLVYWGPTAAGSKRVAGRGTVTMEANGAPARS